MMIPNALTFWRDGARTFVCAACGHEFYCRFVPSDTLTEHGYARQIEAPPLAKCANCAEDGRHAR